MASVGKTADSFAYRMMFVRAFVIFRSGFYVDFDPVYNIIVQSARGNILSVSAEAVNAECSVRSQRSGLVCKNFLFASVGRVCSYKSYLIGKRVCARVYGIAVIRLRRSVKRFVFFAEILYSCLSAFDSVNVNGNACACQRAFKPAVVRVNVHFSRSGGNRRNAEFAARVLAEFKRNTASVGKTADNFAYRMMFVRAFVIFGKSLNVKFNSFYNARVQSTRRNGLTVAIVVVDAEYSVRSQGSSVAGVDVLFVSVGGVGRYQLHIVNKRVCTRVYGITVIRLRRSVEHLIFFAEILYSCLSAFDSVNINGNVHSCSRAFKPAVVRVNVHFSRSGGNRRNAEFAARVLSKNNGKYIICVESLYSPV